MHKTKMLPTFFLLSALVLTLHPTIGLAQQAPGEDRSPAFQERYPRYRIRAGDVMELNFSFTPEFNQTLTVQPDGYVNLRSVGDIRVQDRTVPEVMDAVRKAYVGILRDPVVTVELKDFEKPY